MLLALDRSARSKDADGHLRIEHNLLTKACVSPYGSIELERVPGAERLALQAGRVFKLYRDPAELRRAVSSLEGKPLMLVHKVSTAPAHPRETTIGTVTDPRFEGDAIYGDLIVWDDEGIAAIESGDQRELSLGYRWECDPTPGRTPQGEAYDAVMRKIAYNHCALVESARVPQAMVADSARGFSGIGRKSIGDTKMQQRIRKAFGLDRRAKDEGGPTERFHAILEELGASPEQMKEIGQILLEMENSEEEVEQGEGASERADGDTRPGMADYDDYEPEGEDEEEPDRARLIEGARRIPTAMDAAAKAAFDSRYPGASGIVSGGLLRRFRIRARPASRSPRHNPRRLRQGFPL